MKRKIRAMSPLSAYLVAKPLYSKVYYLSRGISRKGSVRMATQWEIVLQKPAIATCVEVTSASTEYGGIRFTFLDCPGSVEFAQETYNALMGVDAAVVVCEPAMLPAG